MIQIDEYSKTAIYSVAAPVILAVLNGVKDMLPVAWHKYTFFLSLALGLLVAFGTAAAPNIPAQPFIITLLEGLGIGAAASGFYSGVRALARANER